jgi:hypothetical protein
MKEYCPIFEKWCGQYLDDPQRIKNYLINSPAARQIAKDVYQYFVNSGQLEPIEKMEQKSKARIWEAVKQYGMDKAESVKLCKVIYLFENTLQREIV